MLEKELVVTIEGISTVISSLGRLVEKMLDLSRVNPKRCLITLVGVVIGKYAASKIACSSVHVANQDSMKYIEYEG